jgi:DNA replication ATP-dependent helicase Dna2
MALLDLRDVEETIWSPSYGMKGVIDVSIDTRIVQEEGILREDRQWIMPFEIKTGRSVGGIEHRAQTMLYTLLMAERYGESFTIPMDAAPVHQRMMSFPGVEVPAGLLYYTQTDEVIRVPAQRNELRSLIVTRNEMAAYMMTRERKAAGPSIRKYESRPPSITSTLFLPPTIDNEWSCSNCYNVDACMLYRKVRVSLSYQSLLSWLLTCLLKGG